jgi:DNA-binding GntR family transcriptional regulator
VTGRRHLSDDVTAQIRDLIVSGQVRSGDFLRLEPLAQQFGTSVTPVREALGVLRGEGFVDLQPNRGFVVLPLSRTDIEDIYRVHAFVSGELAALACRRLSQENVEAIIAVQRELERAHDRDAAEEVAQLNQDFHRRINNAAGSPRLLWFLKTASRYAPRMFFAQIDGWTEASAREHQEILTALQTRDPERARASMAAHVHSAGELLARHHERRA